MDSLILFQSRLLLLHAVERVLTTAVVIGSISKIIASFHKLGSAAVMSFPINLGMT